MAVKDSNRRIRKSNAKTFVLKLANKQDLDEIIALIKRKKKELK